MNPKNAISKKNLLASYPLSSKSGSSRASPIPPPDFIPLYTPISQHYIIEVQIFSLVS